MSSQVCEMCAQEVAKYCCPGCGKRTCSLRCVKEHKIKYSCEGLKGVPTAPEAAEGPEKYTEALFVRDYNFLEGISSYAGKLERERVQIDLKSCKNEEENEGRKKRVLEFKRIQKVGKLAELRMLPREFSRSKKNRTRIVGADESKIGEDCDEEEPEKKSSRRGKICWTLDIVEYDNCRLIETRYDVSDETILRDLLHGNRETKRVYLKNETRAKGVDKWKEISSEMDKTLAQVLIGSRIFEYPIFAIEQEIEE